SLVLPRTTIVYAYYFVIDTTATEIYTLSLHDALPILIASLQSPGVEPEARQQLYELIPGVAAELRVLLHERAPDKTATERTLARSEEHTSELQSRENLVCRLLLEKKK